MQTHGNMVGVSQEGMDGHTRTRDWIVSECFISATVHVPARHSQAMLKTRIRLVSAQTFRYRRRGDSVPVPQQQQQHARNKHVF